MKWAVVALAAAGANAFPNILNIRDVAQPGCTTSKLCNTPVSISNAQANIPSTPNAATKASAARTNCGALGVCNTFDAKDQYVSTTGAHAYQSPSASQIRGPCPGLNAAANHGYLPRSGLATIAQTITGLGEAYNMSPDLAGFLAAYAIALDGDLVTGQWSIGGPIPKTLLGGVTGAPSGISYSHNNYEGDTSIGRCDAYTNGGDAHSLSTVRFSYAYETGQPDDRYTLDKFAQDFAKNTHRSIQQNPAYFTGLFSTTLVSPAAYNFVINFMSNHSAEEPAGYLNGEMFKQFFAVSGDYPNFTWNKGQERIPNNWYRRPTENQYNVASVFGDLAPQFLAYPDTFRFGGNTNGVNTYTGIDLANATGGVYNADTLFQGDNFACFFFEAEQQLLPTELSGLTNDVASVIDGIFGHASDYFGKLQCPSLSKFDTTVFDKYTGYKYTPTAPYTAVENC